VSVSVDGGEAVELPRWAALACSFDGAGAGLMLAPGAKLDDRSLDLIEIGDLNRREALFQIIPGLKDGSYTQHAKAARRLAREVRFTAREAIPVDVDGEPMGVTPLTVRMMDWGLPVAVV
jgi:diacylglycerol kinase family enzyme